MIDVKESVKHAAMAADRVAPPPDGITILIYHRVGGGSDSAVDLTVDQFERQLEHLREHHRVITLDEAVTAVTAGRVEGWSESQAPATASSPGQDDRRQVVITFDDGTADFGDHAVPALARHDLPATLYVATKFVDEGLDFPWGAPPATWSALHEAAATGLVTIGSHTHSHWLLDRLDRSAIDGDLDRSTELIEREFGGGPRHFAYPKALPGSPAAEIAVRRRFTSAALAASRVNRPGRTDLHRLWRTPVQRTDDPSMFAAKANGGLRLEGEIRALAARVRYRGSAR
jgi:peptidoglycan/xylan/chitin deacetylase (PgdA/CDA1 family)